MKTTNNSKIISKKTLTVVRSENETDEQSIATFATKPAVNAALVVDAYNRKMLGEKTNLAALIETVQSSVAKLKSGDVSNIEAILMSQSLALQAIFTSLALRATDQTLVSNYQTLLSLALKAQAQCRTTLETLSAIKNPPIIYAKQANVTSGPQQINNGRVESARSRENRNEQNQLSGGTHELLPDTRASGKESRVNPALEALGEIDRAKDARR